jgi:hypothetical protein
MLLKAIEQLIESQNLNTDKAQILTRSIYRFALKLNNAKQLKIIGSKFKITPALMEFKRIHLNNSHYVLSRLWRAVYSYYCEQRSCARCSDYPYCFTEKLCEKFEWDLPALAEEYTIDMQDLMYIIHHNIIDMSMDMDQKILDARKNVLYPANPQMVNEVILETMSYIKYIVHKKLAFIFKYNNLDPIDFINDLMAWALSHLNDNDYITDKEQLTKIARNSVNQMSVNIIAQYTAQKRSRLVSTQGGYQSTIVSLEAQQSKDTTSSSLNEEDLLKRICLNMTPDEIYFLQARLAGKSKGDILIKLQWTNKQAIHFKDKVKNLLCMCVV